MQVTKGNWYQLVEPKKDQVPLLIDDVTLSYYVGFRTKILWYFILKTDQCYTEHRIPKANGKLRLIHAPNPQIKYFLNKLRKKLLVPLCEELGTHVVAYRTGQGARRAAEIHMQPCPTCDQLDQPHTCTYEAVTEDGKYRVVKNNPDCQACATLPKHECPRRGTKIKIDLKDFFNSTKPIWIRDYFQNEIGYNKNVASLLAAVMTVPIGKTGRRGVPQGAPTSGDICNLVADARLDRPLLALLEGSGWTYTRYADDLYFSHPNAIEYPATQQFIKAVYEVIKKSGWRVNYQKLEIQRPGGHQRLLGMTVNQKINVQRDQYMRLRTIVHRCFYDGFDVGAQIAKVEPVKMVSWLRGQINWFSSINPAKAARIDVVFQEALSRGKHV